MFTCHGLNEGTPDMLGLMKFLPGDTAGLIFNRATTEENDMPILLWLLGVPLSLVVVLWLFHVI